MRPTAFELLVIGNEYWLNAQLCKLALPLWNNNLRAYDGNGHAQFKGSAASYNRLAYACSGTVQRPIAPK
jgi:hypothetical protein